MTVGVLHLMPQLGPGGPGRATLAIARASAKLADLDHRIASLRPAHGAMRAEAEATGVGVLDAAPPEDVEEAISAADVVHLHHWNSPELTELLERELPPMRLLLWPHTNGSASPQVLPPELAAAADLPVATSSLTAESIRSGRAAAGAPDGEVAVIPPIAGWERLESVERSGREGFNVGYIGTVGFVKLHPRFAEICADVRIPDVRFILAGVGDATRALPHQAYERGAADRFEFLGQVEDIGTVLSDLDVFGFPLRADGTSSADLVLTEAMYAGVPPVVLRDGAGDMLVEDGATGVVASSPDACSRAIERLDADPDERRRLGANARERARALWSPEVVAPLWESAYEKVMSGEKRRRPAILATPSDPGLRGAIRFIRGLGADGGDFDASLNGSSPDAAEADRRIAGCSPVIGFSDGGIVDHARRYRDDAMLALWTGLFMGGQGRRAFSAGELARARRLGCPPARIERPLRQAVEA